ncbi:hypothetical protein DPMN_130123 [Dreissena polymorpha]|uniref:Uncharacterized protein n=1 Tax=Dreissena polymorpha TaxID=45954 RepID=A0A9D4JXA9_DREPO|nr:hypothetical protein DPMN_130123 [Dreissena polymorpha]
MPEVRGQEFDAILYASSVLIPFSMPEVRDLMPFSMPEVRGQRFDAILYAQSQGSGV